MPLNDFIGSTLSMASPFGFAGYTSTLSLPVPHSLRKRAVQDSPNNVAFKRTVSLLDTARVQRTVSNFGSDVFTSYLICVLHVPYSRLFAKT